MQNSLFSEMDTICARRVRSLSGRVCSGNPIHIRETRRKRSTTTMARLTDAEEFDAVLQERDPSTIVRSVMASRRWGIVCAIVSLTCM